MDWVEAWVITALQCIDTETSRNKALDIAKSHPLRRNRKRNDITPEICRRRDRKRWKSLHYRLGNLNLDRY